MYSIMREDLDDYKYPTKMEKQVEEGMYTSDSNSECRYAILFYL